MTIPRSNRSPETGTGSPIRSRLRVLSGATGLIVLAWAAPAPASGQQATSPATGTFRGRVITRDAERPIAGATIALDGDSVRARTDSAGQFRIDALVPGSHAVIVRAIGFVEVGFNADVRVGGRLEYLIRLEAVSMTAQALAPVSVITDAPQRQSYRLVDFERRRLTGRGQYLGLEEIEKSRAATLQDLARGMRGVTVHCGGGGGCQIQMVRAPAGCRPEYVVDGRVDNMFGAATPIGDIVGLEVYTGPSDVPGEFAGTNAGCGVVVIWTRAGPPPAKK